MNLRSVSVIAILLALVAFGCAGEKSSEVREPQSSGDSEPVQKKAEVPEVLAPLLAAHKVDAVAQFDEVSFDLHLRFRGKDRLRGSYRARTNSTGVWLTREDDGATVAYTDGGVHLWPPDADWPRARFDVLTWHYFFWIPYKLTDDGANVAEEQIDFSGSGPESILRLTFGTGVGDAPDDWYLIRRDSTTGLIDAVAYIVTYSKSVDEAETDPHAILYTDYRDVQGVPIAHRWTFHYWGNGVGEQLGEATISNVEFVETAGEYAVPGEARVVER